MRKGIGNALVALAVAAALLGLAFALFAGGYEADALRVGGIQYLLLATADAKFAGKEYSQGKIWLNGHTVSIGTKGDRARRDSRHRASRRLHRQRERRDPDAPWVEAQVDRQARDQRHVQRLNRPERSETSHPDVDR